MKYLTFLTLTLLAACATPYSPQEGTGRGYSDVQVNTDSFVVGFKGGAPLRTKELALLRSAEVALENGYQYFVVAQIDDLSTVYTYDNLYSPHDFYFPHDFYYGATRTIKRPHYVYTIVCYSGKPETPSYSARMVLENISAKHGIER